MTDESSVAVTNVAAFDSSAGQYDEHFTDSTLGRTLRAAVWKHLDGCFSAGQRVLELGCGTGEDARHLAARGLSVGAVDQSTRMLEMAAAKSSAQPVSGQISLIQADFNDADFWLRVDRAQEQRDAGVEGVRPASGNVYDGAFSNFGAMNCVHDRVRLAAGLAARVRSGGTVVLVVMGPLCLVETAAFLLRGRWRDATRRWRRTAARATVGQGGRSSGAVEVRYPSARRLTRELAPWFSRRSVCGIGTVLPTTEMSSFVERNLTLFRWLARIEPAASRLMGGVASDHYLLQLERRAT